MSDTRVTVMTPPGTGAIATLAITGPQAWAIVASHFHPANGRPLPITPSLHQIWFGKLGEGVADEVVVAVKSITPEPVLEVHCHGGVRVVQWLVGLLTKAGCHAAAPHFPSTTECDGRAVIPLSQALTVRTAGILLDQYHGAFQRTVTEILTQFAVNQHVAASERLAQLARFAPLGHHFVSPWKVVIAGPPNVGKSSLINALVGYQRSVVAPVAGTTRDVVTATVALDGWPIELSDTAGLRDASESLESAGIDLAQYRIAIADLIVWVVDSTNPNPVWPDWSQKKSSCPCLVVANKSDQPAAWSIADAPIECDSISATTGAGVQPLATRIVRTLIPHVPAPGDAVPFTPELALAVRQADHFHTMHNDDGMRLALTSCLPGST